MPVSPAKPATKTPSKPAPKSRAKPATRRRRPADPYRAWAKQLERRRPGLVAFVLERLTEAYGPQVQERRLDPTSELILTILTQNSADVNAEKAFEALRLAYPSTRPAERHIPGIGWGGTGLTEAPPPDWPNVEVAPLPELVDVIRPGGLGPQKAPRIQAALRTIREEHGDHSLDFLAELPRLEAREWLTRIGGIGKKTASIVLLFCFGTPLMPVDRHVERVSHRIGLIPPKAGADEAHEYFLSLLGDDDMYAAHVLLIHHGREICHARKPDCAHCPIAPRCRYFDPKAP